MLIKHLRLQDDSASWLFLDCNCPFCYSLVNKRWIRSDYVVMTLCRSSASSFSLHEDSRSATWSSSPRPCQPLIISLTWQRPNVWSMLISFHLLMDSVGARPTHDQEFRCDASLPPAAMWPQIKIKQEATLVLPWALAAGTDASRIFLLIWWLKHWIPMFKQTLSAGGRDGISSSSSKTMQLCPLTVNLFLLYSVSRQ